MALVWPEEYGMATRPRRSRTTRAGPKTPQPEETTPTHVQGLRLNYANFASEEVIFLD